MKLLKNIPNILTIVRIILVYVFISVFFTEENNRNASSAIFILAGLTDIADGCLARRFNCITDFGKVADPLADKLMQCTVLSCLCIDGIIPLWLAIVYVTKESLFLVVSFLIIEAGTTIVKSNIFGKTATAVFYAVITVSLFFPEFCLSSPLYSLMCTAVLACSVISAAAYYMTYHCDIQYALDKMLRKKQ